MHSIKAGVYRLAIETFEAMGIRSFSFVKELGHRVRQWTGEVKARAYFCSVSQ